LRSPGCGGWTGRPAPAAILEDARERQVLRVAGPVYQFRHAPLQERLELAFDEEAAAGAR
jgi:hypothetical protein